MTIGFHTTVHGYPDLPRLRSELRGWLEAGVDPDSLEDLLLAVTELTTNGIEASPAGVAAIEGQKLDGAVQLEVCDDGPGFDWTLSSEADVLRERGRGVDLVRCFVDDLTYRRGDHGTSALITKVL